MSQLLTQSTTQSTKQRGSESSKPRALPTLILLWCSSISPCRSICSLLCWTNSSSSSFCCCSSKVCRSDSNSCTASPPPPTELPWEWARDCRMLTLAWSWADSAGWYWFWLRSVDIWEAVMSSELSSCTWAGDFRLGVKVGVIITKLFTVPNLKFKVLSPNSARLRKETLHHNHIWQHSHE